MKLDEWVRNTVVVGPADEPMLRRAKLLEELADYVGDFTQDDFDRVLGRNGGKRVSEILAALKEE